jgi:PAS domain S-box-containing protein
MFSSITIKTKILIPMFLLATILTLISISIVSINYSKMSSLKALNEKVVFGSEVADTLHSLQKERGLSCGFIINSSLNFKKQMFIQRKLSDVKIRRLFVSFQQLSCKKFKDKIEPLLKEINKLSLIRKKIDNHQLTYNSVINSYSQINQQLLNIFILISKDSHLPIMTQNILAYCNFLYLKEYKGIERAIGVAIFSKKKIDRETLLDFSNILTLEKRSESMFYKYASADTRRYYDAIIKKPIFSQIREIEKGILYEKLDDFTLQPEEWFQKITTTLSYFDNVLFYIKTQTLRDINKELNSLSINFLGLSIVILSTLFIFLYMLSSFFKLVKEEQRLRMVMDKYIISSTTDLSGKIIDVSEAFCKISGYSRKELIGKPHNIVRHPDMPKEAFAQMWKRIKNGQNWNGKVKNRKKDGGFYWVYANVEPLFNADGEIESYISVRLDITESELLTLKVKEEERKNKLNEALIREQSRLAQMGEMLSMIAHQWRQPLSAIAAAAGSLKLKAKRDKLDSETALEIAQKINNFAAHLSDTIDDFRNFFKSNKKETLTDFQTILNSVLSITEPSLAKNNIELKVTIQDTQQFSTFENELKQVILNLIKNAEDALVEKNIQNPYIKITIDKTHFSIEDNAGGIADDIIGKIFDPYFSTKNKKDGTGLGLYMSKIIIEDHCHGQLIVSNEDKGAKFQIILKDGND